MKKISLIFSLLFCSMAFAKKADLVIFSYDRAMQLEALLETIDHYVTGIDKIYVIYRSTSDWYEKGFEKVKKKFTKPLYIKQSNTPHQDFKKLTLECIYNLGKADYVFFAVDDQVFKDYVDIEYCTEKMEQYNAYAFYLRLGMHFDWCYSAQVPQKLPNYKQVEKDLCLWNFVDGEYEFNYPHDTVSAIYRKEQIRYHLETMPYVTPNTFEGRWATYDKIAQPALCFNLAKTLMLPINKVQTDNGNIAMNVLEAEHLNKMYLEGYYLNWKPLHKVVNNACCYEYIPELIK